MKILTPPARSELPVFLSKPLSPTIHHSRSHYDQKNIPFHSCCYHSATNHLWHSSPPRLHSLLHLFFVLSVAFDTRYLYSSTVTTSTPCMFIFPSVFTFIHTHISSLASTDFHPSSHQCVCLPYQVLFHLRPIEHNVVCKHHSTETPGWPHLWTCPLPLQTRKGLRVVMSCHCYLELICESYQTPHCCLPVLVHVLHHSHILLSYPWFPHVVPHFISWHCITFFFLIQFLLTFPVLLHPSQSIFVTVVLFLSVLPLFLT